MESPLGILLTSHGTVSDLDELPQFLARIRGGRPVSAELLAETRRRYALIGGSPLLRITQEQAALLSRRLGLPVLVGMRLSDPSVEDALERAEELRLTRLITVPLAPFSVHVYAAAAEASRRKRIEAGGRPPELVTVPGWGTHPAFIRAHAAAIRAALKPEARLILTAHSLPLVALRSGDPYERLVKESADAIGKELGIPFELAFQSQGADGGEWLGPSLRQALEQARASEVRKVVLAPFGFLTEHVETLYDLDVEARAWCAELGLELVRVPALGTAPDLIETLAELVKAARA
ncbi:MAG TPA: ferrochelatase [Polyangiaceae bacterium]|jgi:ferrochelatase|nr:ferrochelatase [Polyangiaceae bacterium]